MEYLDIRFICCGMKMLFGVGWPTIVVDAALSTDL